MTTILAVPAVIGLAAAYCWVAGVVYGKLRGGPCEGARGPHAELPHFRCDGVRALSKNFQCMSCNRTHWAQIKSWSWPLAPLFFAYKAGLAVFGWGADVTVAPKDKTHALHD